MVDYEGNVDKDITEKGDSRDTSEEDDDRNTIEEANDRTPWSISIFSLPVISFHEKCIFN